MRYILSFLLILLAGVGIKLIYDNTQMSVRIAELEGDPSLIKQKPWVTKTDLGKAQTVLNESIATAQDETAQMMTVQDEAIKRNQENGVILQSELEELRTQLALVKSNVAAQNSAPRNQGVKLSGYSETGNSTPTIEADTVEDSGVTTVKVALHQVDGKCSGSPKVGLVQLNIPRTSSPLRESLNNLFAGKGSGAGLGSIFPLSGLALNDLSLNSSVALIKVPKALFDGLDSCARNLAEAQIRATATQFDGVRSVQIVDTKTSDYVF